MTNFSQPISKLLPGVLPYLDTRSREAITCVSRMFHQDLNTLKRTGNNLISIQESLHSMGTQITPEYKRALQASAVKRINMSLTDLDPLRSVRRSNQILKLLNGEVLLGTNSEKVHTVIQLFSQLTPSHDTLDITYLLLNKLFELTGANDCTSETESFVESNLSILLEKVAMFHTSTSQTSKLLRKNLLFYIIGMKNTDNSYVLPAQNLAAIATLLARTCEDKTLTEEHDIEKIAMYVYHLNNEAEETLNGFNKIAGQLASLTAQILPETYVFLTNCNSQDCTKRFLLGSILQLWDSGNPVAQAAIANHFVDFLEMVESMSSGANFHLTRARPSLMNLIIKTFNSNYLETKAIVKALPSLQKMIDDFPLSFIQIPGETKTIFSLPEFLLSVYRAYPESKEAIEAIVKGKNLVHTFPDCKMWSSVPIDYSTESEEKQEAKRHYDNLRIALSEEPKISSGGSKE